MASAQQHATQKRYAEAATLFVKLARTYEGSPCGQSAKRQMDRLKSDPVIQAAIAQIELDAKADSLEAQAKAAEGKKDYAIAVKL